VMPAGELTHTHIDLETLWGARTRELRERLYAAATPMDRFRLLEESLMGRLPDRPVGQAAVRAALTFFARTGAGARVREIARAVRLSQRRLIEVFTAEVGMTPKLFSRVQRFQRALALTYHTIAPDWATLAVECGYFDQSHLIRDFLEFSASSPAD